MQSVTSQFYMKPICPKPDDKPTLYSTWETLKGYSILWVATKYWKWQWFNHIDVLPHAVHMGYIVTTKEMDMNMMYMLYNGVQVYTLFKVHTKFWVAASWWLGKILKYSEYL